MLSSLLFIHSTAFLSSHVTFSSGGAVALQGDALLVVLHPQHAALLLARRLCGASGQDHPDLPAVHVQIPPLPHVHILRCGLLGKTLCDSIVFVENTVCSTLLPPFNHS